MNLDLVGVCRLVTTAAHVLPVMLGQEIDHRLSACQVDRLAEMISDNFSGFLVHSLINFFRDSMLFFFQTQV